MTVNARAWGVCRSRTSSAGASVADLTDRPPGGGECGGGEGE